MMITGILKSRVWPAAGQFVATSFIYLGLVLLAWGIQDIESFISHPVRMGFVVIVIVQALIGSWMVYRTPPHVEHEHHFDLARWHSYMFETIFVLASFGDRRNVLAWDENMPLRWLGLGIYLAGFALATWANMTWVDHLRREGDRAVAHPVLLFKGPYAWIRFPSLLALAIYCLGLALMFRSWAGVALLVPLVWGIINRIDNMEKIFAIEYRKSWPLRRHTSRRLIPRVY